MTASLRLTIVCENTVGRPLPLVGEHGFACLVDTAAGRLLFDTGRGQNLLHNLRVLEIDPHSIDMIVLSHGHNDHAGGLLPLLQQIGPRPVIAHRGIFAERYFVKGLERRDISLGVSRQVLEAAGARFRFCEQMTEVVAGVWFSGYVPRLSADEPGDPCLVSGRQPDGAWLPDAFDDDAALAILSPRGLVVLLGCAHAGLINTVEHFRRHLDNRPVHAIIGGTHLGPVSEPQFVATAAYLASLAKVCIGVSHCTGQVRSARLFSRFPEQVFFAAGGSEFVC